MPRLTFAPAAADALRRLPADRTLLRQVWRQLELIADDVPGRSTTPPPFPHRQDRRFAAFEVEVGDRTRWMVSVTVTSAGEVVTVHTAHAPDHPDGD
jgi:hypothetical protein